jgi:hypothetical protein
VEVQCWAISMTAPVGSATEPSGNAPAAAGAAPMIANAIDAECSKRMILSHRFVLRPPCRCTPAILLPARGRGKSAGGPAGAPGATVCKAQKGCRHQALLIGAARGAAMLWSWE